MFTPEAERSQTGEGKKGSTQGTDAQVKSGRAAALAGFLAGFVPWNDSKGQLQQLHAQLEDDNGKLRTTNDDDTDPWHPTTPTPKRRLFAPAIETSDASSAASSSTYSSRSPPFLHERTSKSSLKPPGSVSSRDARSALRHMISTPDIPKRPQLAKARRVTDDPSSKLKRARGSESSGTPPPPMPANWLSTVTRAVIGAGPESGVHIGGPPASIGSPYGRRRRAVPKGMKDNTYNGKERRAASLARRGFTPHTPRGRVNPAPGIVTPASVVCRSAPGSRSASIVRTRSRTATSSSFRGKGSLSRRNSGLLPHVPSLGVTIVEGLPASLDITARAGPRLRLNSESGGEDTDTDDDDPEPDFAQLIVPARRQHSIQSLRRHLHVNSCANPGTSSPGPAAGRLRPPLLRSGSGSATNSAQSSVRRALLRRDSRLFGGAGAEHSEALLSSNYINSGNGGSIRPTHEEPDEYDALEQDNVRRSRRGSLDEGGEEGLAFWAAHGLPGLETAVQKKRAALPWSMWSQTQR